MSFGRYETILNKKKKMLSTLHLMKNIEKDKSKMEVELNMLPPVTIEGIQQLLEDKKVVEKWPETETLGKYPPKVTLTSRAECSCLRIKDEFREPMTLKEVQELIKISIGSCELDGNLFETYKTEKLTRMSIIMIEGISRVDFQNQSAKIVSGQQESKKRKPPSHGVLKSIWEPIDNTNNSIIQKWVPPIWLGTVLPISAPVFKVHCELYDVVNEPLTDLFFSKPSCEYIRNINANFNDPETENLLIEFVKNQPKVKEQNLRIRESFTNDKFDRRKLLLSVEEMMELKYPFTEPGNNIINSKQFYTPVRKNSPMFGLDCEMCLTKEGSELSWISLVDENFDIIYQTLVKPLNKITNYQSEFSGVTKSMLLDVETTLKDVQKRLRALLPSDAILVGQSFVNDLRVLKMSHPYCIDTAFIYNLTGNREMCPGLKMLSYVFMNKIIQRSTFGHDPTEDAISCLELVKLKLSNSITFGDKIADRNAFNMPDLKSKMATVRLEKKCIREYGWPCAMLVNIFGNNEKDNLIVNTLPQNKEHFMNVFCKRDKWTIRDNCTDIGQLLDQAADPCQKEKYQIIYAKLSKEEADKGKTYKKIDEGLIKIYNSLPSNSLLLTIFTGAPEVFSRNRGILMFHVKDTAKQNFYKVPTE